MSKGRQQQVTASVLAARITSAIEAFARAAPR
jgi:hypothetical protein